ncbi:hypothetical protein RHO12_01650 [Orbus sturtevantii]|uniref:hypothetical protein n=1 Tax=Orbus sturtevantii TaxID=3074109 RepID=UPI00370D8302
MFDEIENFFHDLVLTIWHFFYKVISWPYPNIRGRYLTSGEGNSVGFYLLALFGFFSYYFLSVLFKKKEDRKEAISKIINDSDFKRLILILALILIFLWVERDKY